MINWIKIRKRYEDELLKNVIPFWEKYSPDFEYGGFFTCLDRNGTIFDTEKFMWMQWRIVYMFSELFLSKFSNKRFLELALNGADFLIKYGKDSENRYYFSLNRKGVPTVCAYNIYTECFAGMACASLYKATGEMKFYNESLSCVKKYIERMNNPKGKWEKSLEGKKHYLSLGHYMMLANLGYVVKTRLNDNSFDNKIDETVSFVIDNFVEPSNGILLENICDEKNNRFDFESSLGRHINPGHGLEALWFFLQWLELKKNLSLIKRVSELIISTLNFAWDRKYGGIFYFMDILNKPHFELTWDMKLWWVHCEAIVATLYGFVITQNKLFLKWFKIIDRWTWKHFPDKKYPEWFGYLNRKGEPTHMLKGGKWKTFFHLPRMLSVSLSLIDRILKL